MVFNATFNNISLRLYIVAVSFIGGGNRSHDNEGESTKHSYPITGLLDQDMLIS